MYLTMCKAIINVGNYQNSSCKNLLFKNLKTRLRLSRLSLKKTFRRPIGMQQDVNITTPLEMHIISQDVI